MSEPVYKVLVCGGRDYADRGRIRAELETLKCNHPGLFIIHGGARGADLLADTEARRLGVPVAEVRAQWRNFGPGSGPIRNQWMLALEPDLVLAFPGGRGTAHMMKLADDAGVPLKGVLPPTESEFQCDGCHDQPTMTMGPDNMDIYSIPCPDCGRDGDSGDYR